MSKRKKSPAYYTLLIPGIFMAILGTGNILLGSFKYEQYQNTLLENTQLIDDSSSNNEPIAQEKELSPLRRLKHTDNHSSRILALIRKAKARRDLYSLVIYGGKVFLLISSFLLTGAVIKRYFENSMLDTTIEKL